MKTQVKGGDKPINSDANKDMQDEMVGVLTAISIVSKRLANRLLQLDEEKETEHETDQCERSM